MCSTCPDLISIAYLSGEAVLENSHLNSTSRVLNDLVLKGSWLKSKSGVSLLWQEGQFSPKGKEKKILCSVYPVREKLQVRCNIENTSFLISK